LYLPFSLDECLRTGSADYTSGLLVLASALVAEGLMMAVLPLPARKAHSLASPS
jgi:hypothetical protein